MMTKLYFGLKKKNAVVIAFSAVFHNMISDKSSNNKVSLKRTVHSNCISTQKHPLLMLCESFEKRIERRRRFFIDVSVSKLKRSCDL